MPSNSRYGATAGHPQVVACFVQARTETGRASDSNGILAGDPALSRCCFSRADCPWQSFLIGTEAVYPNGNDVLRRCNLSFRCCKVVDPHSVASRRTLANRRSWDQLRIVRTSGGIPAATQARAIASVTQLPATTTQDASATNPPIATASPTQAPSTKSALNRLCVANSSSGTASLTGD